jgi:MYXO-CTERM domain-containing protein
VAALETHTFATDPDLAWLVPDCDEGFDPDATCPNLDPGGGCAVAPGAGLGLAIAAMAVLRRRRSVACALLVAGSAHAAPAARWEIAALWAPLSTERISAERDDYAHGLGPMAGGADIRWAFAGDERRSLGLSLGATVWRGDGVSGQAVVPRFTGADPFLGLSFRQGGWREGPLRPTAVVGIGLAAPALMPSIGAGESVLTSDLSLGAGAVIGRGTRRLLVELRSDLLPRTDGSHVDFDDRTGLPGWIWHYGRLSGTLRVGLALGPSQATPSSRPASSSAR